MSRVPNQPQQAERSEEQGGRHGDRSVNVYLLVIVLVAALASHAYNMFRYPLYLGDEGIYTEQAWAVLRLGKLSPYTYFYDHAPAGWILIAWWVLLLPARFFTFGMAINSGRVLMLIIHVINVYLLYRITKNLSGSDWAAFMACMVFSLSPLALFYQRMVLLDNIMVMWVLVSIFTTLYYGHRVLTLIGSGLAFGLALLTKENAIFFAPTFAYLLISELRGRHNRRFGIAGWTFTAFSVLSVYPLYAALKGELFPSQFTGITQGAATSHVSLIGTVIWQASRTQGSILDSNSLFWQFSLGRWWPKDPIILVAGVGAIIINLFLALVLRNRRKGFLVASSLGMAYIIYLARGSVMLEFYVVPLLPFLSMNFGMLTARIGHSLPGRVTGPVLITVATLILSGIFVRGSRDHYTLDLVQVQKKQIAYIRENIPESSLMVIDDDLWTDLHEHRGSQPVYPKAHSHWKVASDPDVRDKLLRNDWRNIDYVIMSNKMLEALTINNEQLVLEAYRHSEVMAKFSKGDVEVEVRRVVK